MADLLEAPCLTIKTNRFPAEVEMDNVTEEVEVAVAVLA